VAAGESDTSAVAEGDQTAVLSSCSDNDDKAQLETPLKKRRARVRRKAAGARFEPTVLLSVPDSWHEFGAENCVGARKVFVLNIAKRLWVDTEAIPWLMRALREDCENGSVDPPSREKTSDVPGICWNFRDSAWQAKVLLPNGMWAQKTVAVKRRSSKETVTYEHAKERTFAELAAWADSMKDEGVAPAVAAGADDSSASGEVGGSWLSESRGGGRR